MAVENSVDIVESSKSFDPSSLFFPGIADKLTVDSPFRRLPPFTALEHFAISWYDTLC